MSFADIFGVSGAAMVLLAYFMISTKPEMGKKVRYHALNFAGASLILLSLFHSFNLAAALLQVAWMAIALWGLVVSWIQGSRGTGRA